MSARPEVLELRRGTFPLAVIGVIESELISIERAPRQGRDGAPDAWLIVHPTFGRGLTGVQVDDELIVVTWLHRASRSVLEVYPREERPKAITGVFATRSAHRPNPLGLHRVTVREVDGTRLRIGPMEAIDGTPVVDVKAVLAGPEG